MIKKYLTFGIVLMGFAGYCQTKTFIINGTVEGIDTGTIKLAIPSFDSSTKIFENKISIVGGKFIFKGQLAYPHGAIMVIFSQKTIEMNWFYIDEKQSIIIRPDSPYAKLISDSKVQNEYVNQYKPAMASAELKKTEWKNSYKKLNEKYNQNIPTEVDDSMDVLMDKIHVEEDSLLFNYVKLNPKSYIALGELYTANFKARDYKPIYDTCFAYLDEKLKTIALGKELRKKIDEHLLFTTGSLLPPIKVIDLNGQNIILDKRPLNQYTLYDFWFNNCRYCIKQFPRLKDISMKWKHKGFEIIGISVDRKEAEMDWKNAIGKYGLSWDQYCDMNGVEAIKLTVRDYPSNFLMDKNGKIVARNIDLSHLEKLLESNLK